MKHATLVMLSIGWLAIALSQSARASAWVGPFTPTKVRSSGTYAEVMFNTVEALYNPAGCAAFYSVSAANQSQAALAVLLSAYTTSTQISIYVLSTGCNSSGGIIVSDVMTSP